MQVAVDADVGVGDVVFHEVPTCREAHLPLGCDVDVAVEADGVHIGVGGDAHKGGIGQGCGVGEVVADGDRPGRGPVDVSIGVTKDFVQLVGVEGTGFAGVVVDFVTYGLAAFLALQLLEVVLAKGIAEAESPRRTRLTEQPPVFDDFEAVDAAT